MEDALLMRRLADGESAAVGELYDRYGRQVYALALRMLEDAAAAEDVTQECFVKVWQCAGQFDPERGRLVSWILHIAYTSSVDLLRTRKRVQPSRFEPQPDRADISADPATDTETAILAEQVRGALTHLPGEQRQVLEMAYWGAMTQQQIATALGVPLGTVKSRVRLAVDGLRHFLLPPRRKEDDRHARLPSSR